MNLLQRISKWIFSRGTLPYWCILVYDSVTVIASGYFVYYLQHGFPDFVENISQVSFGIGLCFAVYMIVFILFHTFNGVLRFSSFIDLRRVAYSTSEQCIWHTCHC